MTSHPERAPGDPFIGGVTQCGNHSTVGLEPVPWDRVHKVPDILGPSNMPPETELGEIPPFTRITRYPGQLHLPSLVLRNIRKVNNARTMVSDRENILLRDSELTVRYTQSKYIDTVRIRLSHHPVAIHAQPARMSGQAEKDIRVDIIPMKVYG